MAGSEGWIGWAAVKRGARPELFCYEPACVTEMRRKFRKFECREFVRRDIVADRDQLCASCGRVLWRRRILEFDEFDIATPPFSQGSKEALFESGRARGREIDLAESETLSEEERNRYLFESGRARGIELEFNPNRKNPLAKGGSHTCSCCNKSRTQKRCSSCGRFCCAGCRGQCRGCSCTTCLDCMKSGFCEDCARERDRDTKRRRR